MPTRSGKVVISSPVVCRGPNIPHGLAGDPRWAKVERSTSRLRQGQALGYQSSRCVGSPYASEPVAATTNRPRSCSAGCGKTISDGRTSMAYTSGTKGEHPAGCSKRPDLSPAQPWRAETRLIPCNGAAPRLTVVSRFTPHVSRFQGARRERHWRTFSASC